MAVTPLAFSPSPLHPPKGEFPTAPPQNKVCRDRARAFLCSSPVTVPAFFPCRAQARALPAISAAPWTGSALAFPRAAFSFHKHPRPPAPGGARAAPALRAVMPPATGHGPAPPARLAPHPRSKSLRGWWRRCSRRGRAEASLLTGFVHRRHPVFPRPPSRLQSPAVPCCAPPRRAINTRSRPPQRGSLPASGARRTTASRRPARPSGQRYFPFARSRQTSLRSDCRASGFSTDGSASFGRSSRPRKHKF